VDVKVSKGEGIMVQVLRQQTNSSSASDTIDDGAGIRHQLAERFAINGYSSANEVGFEYCEGVVVLRGHVDSFHEKQLVQEVARKVDGVKIIVNRLMVYRSDFSDTVKRESTFCV
jgi:osmotically-inducible protein OsmY